MEPVFSAMVMAARAMMGSMGWPLLVTGAESVPRSGPAIVVSNHVSYLDAIVIGRALAAQGRLPRYLAKRELFRHPLVGPLARATRQIPVDRGGAAAESLAVASARIAAGDVVVIFPEATISTSFVPAPPKTGAARLALSTGAPIIPVATWGGQRVVTKNRPRSLTRGVVMAVRFGGPVAYEGDEDPAALMGRVWGHVEELADQAQRTYPQQPRGPDDRWWLPRHLGGTAPSVQDGLELRRREAEARRGRATGGA
jgi:1-acyl-sn-glycerol-3-phosphate acyltransferase